MATLQAIIDFHIELGLFSNVDLFQRGFYIIKCGVRSTATKVFCKVEANHALAGRSNGIQHGDKGLEPARIDSPVSSPGQTPDSNSSIIVPKCPAASRIFQVQYRDEELEIRDAFTFKMHLLVEAPQALESICRAGLVLELELHFSDDDYSPTLRSKMQMVSSRSLKMHLDPTRGLHCALPVFFDYFHLCAVNVGVHAALTGLCQPYISTSNKQSKQAWSNETSSSELPTLESVLFNHKNQSQHTRRKQAFEIHRRSCHILLCAYESLQQALQTFFDVLPALRQMQIAKEIRLICENTRLKKNVDCHLRLKAMVNVMEACQTEEDILKTANKDVSALAAANHTLWSQFLEVVAMSAEVEAYLSRKYHQQKTKRHAEAFFTCELGLSQLYALSDGWHEQVASLVRSSVYLSRLPPLQVECTELDGEAGMLPVIFEDVYVAEDPNPPALEQLESTAAEQELSSSRLSLCSADLAAPAGAGGVSAEEVRRRLITRPAQLPKTRPGLGVSRGRGGSRGTDLPAEPSPRQAALVGYRKLSTDNDVEVPGYLGLGTLSPASAGMGPGLHRSVNFSSSASMPDLLAGVAESTSTPPQSTRSIGVEDVEMVNGGGTDADTEGSPTASPALSDTEVGGEMTVMEMLRMADEEDDKEGEEEERTLRVSESTPNLGAVSSSGGARLVQVFSDVTIDHVSRKESLKARLWTDWPALRLYSDFASAAASQAYLVPAPVEERRRARGLHLVVCVHGLDGNSADLRLVKTYLELGTPGERFEWLMSERNQNDTFQDFDTMADNLVNEILSHLNILGSKPSKVSFIGHSMGCLLIRAVLADQRVAFLRPNLWTFLSLSGPHLGTLYNTSGLVNMGIWFMQKFKKSGSMLQMALKDHPDPRHTFLYKLSSAEGMEHFRHVLLVSSPQDRYVPYHSTRIELCRSALKDNTDTGSVYMEMLANILQRFIRIGKTTVVRYDVHHNFQGGGANALIGRAAHIAVLDSEVFLEKFVTVSAAKYFQTPALHPSVKMRPNRSVPSSFVLRRGVCKKMSGPARLDSEPTRFDLAAAEESQQQQAYISSL